MSIWERLFGWLFGRKKQPAPGAPGDQSAPNPPPTSSAPREAPLPPPQAPPPDAPPPSAPPSTPAPAPPPAAGLSLDALRAADPAHITPAQVNDVASRLGVEAEAIRAVVSIESAGQGFAADGRPLILFEPVIFSDLTGHAYDASNPNVSQAVAKPGALGVTQADRWAKLAEAYGLNPGAALNATNWGLFQTSGANAQACGFSDVAAFVVDISRSEARQLAAFEQFIRSKDLMDELRSQDWQGFARVYHGVSGAEKYGKFLQDAYVAEKQKSGGGASFLDSLVAKNAAALSGAEIEAAATRMGVEPACVRAVLKVESKGSGFGPDGRPLILFEPHIFSRLTGNAFDAAHPTVSYKTWKERPYPKTQADRYKQLAEAYQLNAEAALSSASWGLFQIMGMNFAACGFTSATAFVTDMAQSEARMLLAFEQFVRKNNILDELQAKDWAGFARVYNGPGQVDVYAKLLNDAYTAAKAVA